MKTPTALVQSAPSLFPFPAVASLTLALLCGFSLNAAAQTLDSDTDGLIDAWEIQHFGVLNHPDGAPTANPDGDACNNLEECNASTDPNDPASCFVPVLAEFNLSELKFQWPSVLGKKYHIQLTGDLQNWISLSNAAGTTPIDFYGTGEPISADFSNPADPVVTCGVTRELWFHADITGNLSALKAFVDNGGSPLPPDGVEWRPTLKAPSDYADSYGIRYRGFIVPKTTGNYNFYIAGRAQCDFRISTDDNPANLPGPATCFLNDTNLTAEEDWDYLASKGLNDTQKSADIALVAGTRYFFEIWHTNEGQLDHLAVAWELNDSGTIEIVPCDCLRPNTDFSDNNAVALSDPDLKFARVITYGPLGALGGTGGLDSDGDGVSDDVENSLYGFNPFLPDSVNGGAAGNDFDVLAAASVADPASDAITVFTADGLAREDNGLVGSGIPRIKDVARFRIRRSGSLVPKNVAFVINGAVDPMMMGNPTAADFSVETVTGGALSVSGGTYMVSLPFGADDYYVEINPVLDEIVEYPEELQIEVKSGPDYIVGASSTSLATIQDARDDPEFNKYYIATFSKDAAAVTSTSASGATALVLNGSNTVATVNDFFENLTSTQSNSHIHKAALKPDNITYDVGPIVEPLPLSSPVTTGGTTNHTYTIHPSGAFGVQDIINSLEYDNPKQGNPPLTTPLYNNKHSNNNGGGEIWALYRRQPASAFSPTEPGQDRIPPTPPIVPIDPLTEPAKLRRDVARFLTQATFGPTEADIEELVYEIENTYGGDRIAAYDAWMTAQWALPQTLVRDLTLALDMQEWKLRGYFDPTRNGAASPPPVLPTVWPNFPSQNISNFDSLRTNTWQTPDADYPLTGAQETALDNILGSANYVNRVRAQWTVMANARDQLRQRVGFSLQEILVISQELTDIRNHHIAAARWVDMLAENADDHFREVLEDVSYSPLMGKYLSHLQNSSELASGVPPDENYAREIMQLFTIGLLELWDDGFIKLDPAEFSLLPTYDNDDIQELARVFTGMSWSTNSGANTDWDSPTFDRDLPDPTWYDDGAGNLFTSSRYNYPMAFYSPTTGSNSDKHHDLGSKTIAGGLVINNPNNSNDGRYFNAGDKDLRDVHNYFAGTQNSNTGAKTFAASWSNDPMVNHQSTPAFISRRLIQRLVTSNPSGPYLYRVVQVWRATNGQLDDVVRAILLDPEARNLETTELNPEFGKKKEPILAWIQANRAVASRSRVTFDGTVISGDPIDFPGQSHSGTLAPTADGDLRNFDYPQTEIDKFQGVVSYDANGAMIPLGGGAFARLQATESRFTNLDGGGTVSLLQSPLKAPTVFNWFLPDYQPGGIIASFGLYAPEFQLANESAVFQNVNQYWTSHWGTTGYTGTPVGGTNSNSEDAGYGTRLGAGNNYSDSDGIPDYSSWINRYLNYPTIPDNGLNNEQDADLQLMDDLDDLLLSGRFKLAYPIDPGDDGTPVMQGSLQHYPNRNPRETMLYVLGDSYNANPPSNTNTWSKIRLAFYLMTTTPEFIVQK